MEVELGHMFYIMQPFLLILQQINQDLNIQLLKDGYRLDEIPDDEDLDLIPPKAVNPTCMCCQATSSTACQIQ